MWPPSTMPVPANRSCHANNYVPAPGVVSCLVRYRRSPIHIMVRHKRTGAEEWIPLEKAAELLGVTADEIEWALEELGEIEAGDYIALEQEW